jgi:predicted RNA-binding Zn ribbon-like protein
MSSGLCTAINVGKQMNDIRSAVQSISDSTQQTRELLEKVNQQISSRPAGDTNRLQGLEEIRNNLTSSLAKSISASNDIGNFALQQVTDGLLWEGLCGAAALPFFP